MQVDQEIYKGSKKQLGSYKHFGLFDQHTKSSLPLKQLIMEAKINDYIAEITYKQTYSNPYDINLETEYFFPITSGVCFHNFQAKFEQTIVKGIVKGKEEAKQIYNFHKDKGDVVAFAEISDENESVMCVKLGNIPPTTEIEVIFSYIERVEISLNKFWRLTLFSCITSNVQTNNLSTTANLYSNTCGQMITTQDDLIASLPGFVKENSQNSSGGIKWEVDIIIDSKSPITFLKSTSHEIEVAQSEMSQIFTAKVSLAAGKNYLPNKDFVLLYATDSINKPSYLLSPYEQGYCALINFFPQINYLTFDDAYMASIEGKHLTDGFLNVSKIEYIFVIDRSSSMKGFKINLAKQALNKLLRLIPNDSYFNILSLGETFSSIKPQSIKKSGKALKDALGTVEGFFANLGQPHIHNVLEYIADSEPVQNHSRVVFYLTSGKTTLPTHEVTQIIKNKFYKTRVFMIGIGDGSMTDFVKKVSLEGYGAYEIIRAQEEIDEKVEHLLRNAVSPYFTDFELKIENETLFSYIVPLPKTLGCIAPNELVEFFIIFNKKLEDVKSTTFTLRFYNGMNHRYEEYRERISISSADPSEAVVKLGILKFCESLAKKKQVYEALQSDTGDAYKNDVVKRLVATSIKHGILTNHTAFVCMVKEGNDITKQIPAQKVTIFAQKTEQDEEDSNSLSNISTFSKPVITTNTEDLQMKVRFKTNDMYGYIDLLRQQTHQIERPKTARDVKDMEFKGIIKEIELEDGPIGDNPINSITSLNNTREGRDSLNKHNQAESQFSEENLFALLPVLKAQHKSAPQKPGNYKLNFNFEAANMKTDEFLNQKELFTDRVLLTDRAMLTERPMLTDRVMISPQSEKKSFTSILSGLGCGIFRKKKSSSTTPDLFSNDLKFNAETVSKLTKLQKKKGCWEPHKNVAKILGSDLIELNNRLPESLRSLKDKEKIWFTILVLSWVSFHYQTMTWWPSYPFAIEWLKKKGINYQNYHAFAKTALSFKN